MRISSDKLWRYLPIAIALRNIHTKRDNRFISFVAFISTLGLILGVATLITVLSVMNGFKHEMETKLLGVIPHIQAYAPTIDTDWQPIADKLKQVDDNIAQISPTLNAQVMLTSSANTIDERSHDSHVLQLSGIVPEYERQLSFLGQSSTGGQGVVVGSLDDLQANTNMHPIIIGETLAREMSLKVGDTTTIILPKANNSVAGVTPVAQNFTITGIFRLSKDVEKRVAFTSLVSVANALETPVGAHGYRMQLHDVFSAQSTADKVATAHPDFFVQSWVQTHGSMYEVIQMNRNMSALLLFLIIIVAGFNLVSSLVMVVTDKKSDIAILKTMGATPATIRAIFFWQGLIITVVGTAVGAVLGLVVASNIGWISAWINTRFELGLFDSYFVTQLPSTIRLADVVSVMLLCIIVGIIATLYPAKKAANTAPATALRYE